jgi:hypothetical protein
VLNDLGSACAVKNHRRRTTRQRLRSDFAKRFLRDQQLVESFCVACLPTGYQNANLPADYMRDQHLLISPS